MLIFKNKYDLDRLTPDHSFNRFIREHFGKTGHLQGYLVLIEEGDTHIHLPELKGRLAEIPWEGVSRLGSWFHAVYLTNNEFAIEFLIPDRPWLSSAIRANLEAHLSEL
ncbi:hypothetical protein [Pelovirga terrestris]|uniref:Uncharacterized protein n=1 Tax=Pelovirga terrestris TaxID=2771352 RepID=A0A8J6QSG9_9BACT|nr:hypothetical protein [Pelovirga terrestris]MBD1401663.1 hypothetical protein [Pelovirga terrestris]